MLREPLVLIKEGNEWWMLSTKVLRNEVNFEKRHLKMFHTSNHKQRNTSFS